MATRTDDTAEYEVQHTTADGYPPRRRIATPNAAWSVFTKLRDADDQDARRRATIQGMVDGNPPYKQSELDELGLGNLTNVNFMSMRANLDARAGAVHELFQEVESMVQITPRHLLKDDPQAHHHCAVIAEEFSDTLRDWSDFAPNMDMVVRDSDSAGLGFMLFTDEWDWRPTAYRRGSLLVEPEASVKVDDNEILMVRAKMTASEIYEICEDEEIARKRGWKVSKLRDLLVRVFRGGEQSNRDDKFQRSTWESIQQMVRNNDPEFQQRQFERVRIVHILSREVSGERKISHTIMSELSENPEFLYESYNKYDRMSQVIWWLPYNYGDGTVRSVRGVATYMMQHDDLSNRFLCRVFDAGFMSASLLLQPQTQGDLSRLQFVQHGPYTILPPELKIHQSSFQPQMAPLIQLRGVSEQVMKNNTGTYRQHNEGFEREAQKTARQVIEETSKEARYERAAIAHRYNCLDLLYREMYRRMVSPTVLDSETEFPGQKEARDFVKRCTERGVPREVVLDFPKSFVLSATRAVGMGSLGVKYDLTSQMLQVSGSFDEAGKAAALRDFVVARVGPRNADRYIAAVDRDQILSNETSISLLEWNDITEGHQTAVGSDQNHKLHLDVFIERIVAMMQQTEQAQVQDPVVAYRTLALALEHVKGHLAWLAQDERRRDYVKQLTSFVKEAEQSLRKLKSMAETVLKQMQKQQAEQQQTVANAEQIKKDRELEAKIYEIQQKYQLEAMKQASLNQMRADKTEEQMRIQREKAAADIKRKAEKQIADIQLDNQRLQAELAAQRATQR